MAIRRFKALKKIWRNWLPADAAHQVAFRKEDAVFARAPGPLYCIAVLGKEPVFRNLVRQGWHELSAEKQLRLCLLSGAGSGDASEEKAAGRDAHQVSGGETPRAVVTSSRGSEVCFAVADARNTIVRACFAQVMVNVCRSMVRMEADRDAKFWQMQVNKNVNHHAGFLPLTQRLRIIKKVGPAKKKAAIIKKATGVKKKTAVRSARFFSLAVQ